MKFQLLARWRWRRHGLFNGRIWTSWYVNECNKRSNEGAAQYSAYTYAGQVPGSTTVVCQVTEIQRRG